MSEIQFRHELENEAVMDILNQCYPAVVSTSRVVHDVNMRYRKTLRILNRLQSRGKVNSIGSQYGHWWYSLERVSDIGGTPF